MAKIAFTTDQHLGVYKKDGGPLKAGLNVRARQTVETLKQAMKEALLRGCEDHVGLGDLFDYVRAEPQLEAEVMRILYQDDGSPEPPLSHLFLVGNHDQKSLAAGDHALAPLAQLPNVEVADTHVLERTYYNPRYIENTFLYAVPFQSGRAEDWLPRVVEEALPDDEGQFRVLCIHLGISDTKTPYYLDGAEDSVTLDTIEKLAIKHRLTHVFAGNWHKHQRWTVESRDGYCDVVQVGGLIPNRFSDVDGRFGTMAFLDTNDGKVEVIDVYGPRFVKTANLRELEDLVRPEHARWLYVSATVMPDEADLAEAIIDDLDPYAHEIHFDQTNAETQAAQAVAVATSAESQHGAVMAFAHETPIPEGVDREEVESFVRACMAEAK